MRNILSKPQLIVVANNLHIKFLDRVFSKTADPKIILKHEVSLPSHRVPEKHSGFNTHGGTSHFFDPHTQSKDINAHNAAKVIVEYMEKHVSEHDEIIITAEPKLLGAIRHEINHVPNLHSKTIKDLAKDYVNSSINELQQALENHELY